MKGNYGETHAFEFVLVLFETHFRGRIGNITMTICALIYLNITQNNAEMLNNVKQKFVDIKFNKYKYKQIHKKTFV